MKIIRALLFGLLVSNFGFAQTPGDGGGTDIGNGGGAWVCISGRRMQWIELVDRYEARTELRLNIPAAVESNPSDIVSRLSAKIRAADLAFYQRYQAKLQFVQARWNEMPQSDLREFDDVRWSSRPADSTCANGRVEYRQIVNFRDDDRVLVDLHWYSRLSPLDQALLQVHEAIYALKREPIATGGENAQDSRSTRLLVGYLASDAPAGDYQHLFGRSGTAAELPTGEFRVLGEYVSVGAGWRVRSDLLHVTISYLSPGRYRWRPRWSQGRFSDSENFDHLVATCRLDDRGRSMCQVTFDGGLRFGSSLVATALLDPVSGEIQVEGQMAACTSTESSWTHGWTNFGCYYERGSWLGRFMQPIRTGATP